ncbi:MAG: exonuclease domain-containing protein, partial [Candidatus Berkelbacteria bacterium]|nr:exonuclease domain-containing protein [Candidatus Berkelbacteria bacterium]
YFDTETTGNEQKDFLVQIAYKTSDENFTGLYKPSIKIPPEASAVHHITNKMVADKPSFQESDDLPKIKKLFEDKDSVVVAHNALFDLTIIKKEGIEPKRFICTLRVARHLDPENKIEQYKLQYLRYYLDIEIDATAHDALGDVLVLEQLYERLKKKIVNENNIGENEAIEKMIEISSHPSIFTKLNFGKYKGKKIEEVLSIDRGWLEWLLREKEKSDQIDEDWIYTLKHYLLARS